MNRNRHILFDVDMKAMTVIMIGDIAKNVQLLRPGEKRNSYIWHSVRVNLRLMSR